MRGGGGGGKRLRITVLRKLLVLKCPRDSHQIRINPQCSLHLASRGQGRGETCSPCSQSDTHLVKPLGKESHHGEPSLCTHA